MSGECKIDNIDGKRIKLEDNHERSTRFGVTCNNSVVVCFKRKCMEYFKEQLDNKSVLAYNTYNHTGK